MTTDPGRGTEPRWSGEAAAVATNVAGLRRALVAFAAENGADAGTQDDRHDSPGLGFGLPTILQLAASVSIAAGLDGRGTVVFLRFMLP